MTSQQIGGHSEGITGWNQASSTGRGLAEGGGFSTEHAQTEGTAKEGKKTDDKMIMMLNIITENDMAEGS